MRMHLRVASLLAVAGVTCAFAQSGRTSADSAAGKRPKIPSVVEKKTSNARLEVPEVDFRFGYAPQNAQIGHVYWIRNTGPDTARINDVRPGCGCTKAPLKKKILAPGDSTDVEVIFSTGRYNNKTVKSAAIVSDAAQSVPSLTFSAHPRSSLDSLQPFVFSPPRIDLDSLVAQAESGQIAVRVKNTSTGPLKLSLVSCPRDWFEVEVPSGNIAPGAEETVHVRLPRSIADTVIAKSFTLEASDSAATRFTIPVQKAIRTGPAPTSSAVH